MHQFSSIERFGVVLSILKSGMSFAKHPVRRNLTRQPRKAPVPSLASKHVRLEGGKVRAKGCIQVL
jgi:hypothetical protein